MRVLVTGATGLLGRYVVTALLERGHQVRALVRPSRTLRDGDLPRSTEIARGDVRRRDGLTHALEDVDAVVHLAACVVGDDDSQFASTVVGTENLLDAIERSGVARLVHCSSFSVYDWKAARRTLDEDTPIESDLYHRDGYAVAKTWQERIVSRFAETGGREVSILRPGFIWGPGREEIAAVGHSFGRIHCVFGARRKLPITYVENCAEAFALAVDEPAAAGRVMNIVDDELVTAWRYAGKQRRNLSEGSARVLVPYWLGLANAHLATRFSKAIYNGKGKLPGLLVPIKYRARFRPLRFPNTRAKAALGWIPRYGFDEAWARCEQLARQAEQAPKALPAENRPVEMCEASVV